MTCKEMEMFPRNFPYIPDIIFEMFDIYYMSKWQCINDSNLSVVIYLYI